MHMVGHERIGVNSTLVARRSFLQAQQVKAIILIGEKARRTIVTALNHVVRNARYFETRPARHITICSEHETASAKKTGLRPQFHPI
jgi:hypothetical protein